MLTARKTPEGRVAAWKVNASAVANLTRICRAHDITLVHISSDYVSRPRSEPKCAMRVWTLAVSSVMVERTRPEDSSVYYSDRKSVV